MARELRKAGVFGALSAWEAFCWPSDDDQVSLYNILVAIDYMGIVLGTGKTARGYYAWLATEQLQGASDPLVRTPIGATGR